MKTKVEELEKFIKIMEYEEDIIAIAKKGGVTPAMLCLQILAEVTIKLSDPEEDTIEKRLVREAAQELLNKQLTH